MTKLLPFRKKETRRELDKLLYALNQRSEVKVLLTDVVDEVVAVGVGKLLKDIHHK